MKMRARLLAGAAALAIGLAVGAAQAAGLFQGLPTTTANTQTGNETIPVDTNLTQGLNPASEVFSLAQLNLLPYSLMVLAAASTQSIGTISPNIGTVIFDSTATITRVDLSLPTTPLDGYILRLATDVNITTLTVGAPNGQTVKNAPTTLLSPDTGTTGTLAGPRAVMYLWRLANATWYRLQ
jgi:hypothetical protein